MKNKIITLVLTISLAVASYGLVINYNQTVDMTRVMSEQKVDLNKKSTEIAKLELAIVNKDDNLVSKDMVIEAQDTQINKHEKKITILEKDIKDLKINIEKSKVARDSDTSSKKDINISRQKSNVLYELNVNASAYIAMCDTGCTGITASGEDVRDSVYYNNMGIIATDPSVIPMYSIVEIEGFGGRFIALDTGGAIKGSKIDILVKSTSEAKKFGRKNLKIKVIRKGA